MRRNLRQPYASKATVEAAITRLESGLKAQSQVCACCTCALTSAHMQSERSCCQTAYKALLCAQYGHGSVAMTHICAYMCVGACVSAQGLLAAGYAAARSQAAGGSGPGTGGGAPTITIGTTFAPAPRKPLPPLPVPAQERVALFRADPINKPQTDAARAYLQVWGRVHPHTHTHTHTDTHIHAHSDGCS